MKMHQIKFLIKVSNKKVCIRTALKPRLWLRRTALYDPSGLPNKPPELVCEKPDGPDLF